MIRAHADIDFSIPAMRKWWKLPEDRPAEVINGKLYLLSQPTLYHSRVSMRILFELMRYVDTHDGGEIFHADLGVFLKAATNVVAPDIVFICHENPLILDRKGVFGAPDLLIEVLSPSTKRKDRTIKKQLYEETGVREFWLVDPDSKETWGYLHENGHYDEPLTMNGELHIRILNKTIRF
jgi:Uma2 family endonuclease